MKLFKIKNKKNVHYYYVYIKHYIGGLNQYNKTRKPNGAKIYNKLFDDIVIYTEKIYIIITGNGPI